MSQYCIQAQFNSQVEPVNLHILLETGIKFFLFQRGQIPIPYERLRIADDTSGQNFSHSVSTYNEEGPWPSSILQDHDNISNEDDSEMDSKSNIERIRMLRAQRKVLRQEMLLARRDKKCKAAEANARIVLDDVFMRLRSILLSPLSNVTAVALVFGSSIYHQKEIITFRIDQTLNKKHVEGNENSNKSNCPSDVSPIIRSFCKAIIMSPEFVEFTEKSLRTTFTHLCVVTLNELTDCELKKELILVEDYQHVLNDSSQDTDVHSRLKQKRSLSINLKLKKAANLTTNPSSSSLTAEVDFKKPVNSPSFCYQFPIRFKGIQVRSARPSSE